MGSLSTTGKVIIKDGNLILKISNIGDCLLNQCGRNILKKGDEVKVVIESMKGVCGGSVNSVFPLIASMPTTPMRG